MGESHGHRPSPTADATRLIEPLRTSPTANTPGRLVSSTNGSRWRALAREVGVSGADGSWPVKMKPSSSVATAPASQAVQGSAPMNTNMPLAPTLRIAPVLCPPP